MPTRPRAAVVVGVQDLRRMTGLPASAGPVDPDRVAAVLAATGLDVTDVTLVLGDIPLPGPTAAAAADRIQATSEQQLEALVDADTPARLLSSFLTRFDDGPTPRWAEVGTDGLLVAAALHRALEGGSERSVDVVVVLSDDPDVRVAHLYPTGCPVLYAGCLDDTTRDDLQALGARALELPAEALAAVVGAAEVPADLPAADAGPLRPDEARAQDRTGGRLGRVARRRAVAVVDTYDVMRQAMGALGATRLPGPDEVRAVLGELGVDDVGVTAAIPRVPDQDLLGSGHGWADRAAQFDQLVTEYDEPGADAASARGDLLPGASGPDRPAQRRLATRVLADAYWLLRTSPATTPVYVFADLWDVPALQWHLRGLGVDDPGRLVRVGATPLAVEGAAVSQVVLPDTLLARLVGAPGTLGRRRHLALERAVTDAPDRHWRIVDVVPEESAVLVAPVDDPDLVALAPATGAVGDVLVFDDLTARLQTPHSVVPRLLPTATAPALRTGWVVARDEPTAVLVDLDGDGRPDTSTFTPHDLHRFRPFEAITLQHSDLGLLYVGPADQPSPVEPDDPSLVAALLTTIGPDGEAVADVDGEEMAARLLPGTRAVAGDRLLGVVTDGPRRFLAVTTPLPETP